ncbi:macrophage migration inhibitory factor homolog [Pomacea canaliculata]|uniref:macrophage migration inhibitory factor homolog n=1 Tax=Pomacea canaliculata TaxID=400727 RepID=UPI000D72D338|nr:macrophage migration inhibitory factor homolog [Pomacea canaliculata]
MPVFVLNTNLPAGKIPKSFLADTSSLVAKELGKPEEYVSVRVSPGQMMIFGGTDDPCGMVELESLGSVGGAKNKRLIAAIGHHIQEALGIPQDRFYIKITDVPRENLGFNGKTF